MIDMEPKKRDFDKEAASWDKHPLRVRMATDVAKALVDHVALNPDMDVLDFGCGTGLLTLHLPARVKSVTAVDSSQGMLDVLQSKVADGHISNVRTQHLDLDKGEMLTGQYDLVVSCMTLHHIKETRPLFEQFFNITAPSGYLCIADLDLDYGQFHDTNDGVFHFGFDRSVLRHALIETGFNDVRFVTALEVLKPLTQGGEGRFTVFLMTCRKPGVVRESEGMSGHHAPGTTP
jgi:ubiquinone/menaquinone biosynthesis C-methylase UbiE